MFSPGVSGPEAVRRRAGLREPAVPLHFAVLAQHHPGAARHGHVHRRVKREEETTADRFASLGTRRDSCVTACASLNLLPR